jgi:hypothetical protein
MDIFGISILKADFDLMAGTASLSLDPAGRHGATVGKLDGED